MEVATTGGAGCRWVWRSGGRRRRGHQGCLEGAPAGAHSYTGGWGRQGQEQAQPEGGHGRGHVVRDHGKAEERIYRGGCTLSHEANRARDEIKQNNPQAFVDGSGGDLVWHFTMGRQALTGPSYDRTLYPMSGSPVGSPGSLRTKLANPPVRQPNVRRPLYRMSLPPLLGQPLVTSWKPGPSLKAF